MIGKISKISIIIGLAAAFVSSTANKSLTLSDLLRSLADDPNFQEAVIENSNQVLENSDITIEINNNSSYKSNDDGIGQDDEEAFLNRNFTVSERLIRIDKLLQEIKAKQDRTNFIINDLQNFIFGPLAWMCSKNVEDSKNQEEEEKTETSGPNISDDSDLPTYRYSTEFDNRFIRLMHWIKENINTNKPKKESLHIYDDQR